MQEIIKVEKELCDNVQRTNLEMEAKRGVLAFMISSGTSLEDENYKRYEESYMKAFEAFERAKNNLEKTIVKIKYPNAINWTLDYNTQELTVNY